MTKRWGESGNIFFTLFGAVALVGVVGAATSTLMRGPVGTVVSLNQRAKADSQMQIAMKLAMLESQQRDPTGPAPPDCDSDGLIEPMQPGPAIVGLGGGGQLPSVGSTTNDPWGRPYGYCGWNHGTQFGPITETSNTCASVNPADPDLLDGLQGASGVVIAVISAGPDREFGTTCNPAPATEAASFTRGANGADDIIVSMTYAEANQASGGLWYLSSGNPDQITTGMELDVQQGAQFSSSDVSFQSDARFGGAVDLRNDVSNPNAGWFFLPDQTGLLDSDCGAATSATNAGAMRRKTSGGSQVLQICDPNDTDPVVDLYWADIGGAGAIVAAAGNPGEIQYNDAGVMGANAGLRFNSSGGLSTTGDSTFGADVDVGSNLDVGGALDVTGVTTLTGALNVDGASDFDSTIDVALDATFGASLRGSVGSNATPTYTFTGATNSGMYYSSGGLRFSVGGTDEASITAAGTTVRNLSVTNSATISNDLTVTDELTTRALIVNDDITADRFISRMATTSAALPGFETEPGTGLFSSADNVLSLVTGGASQVVVNAAGDVGIGVSIPNTKLDVDGAIKISTTADPCGPTLHGAIRYFSGDLLQVCSSLTNLWEDIGTSGGGGGGAASYWTRISAVDRRLYYTDDFVGVGTNDPLDNFHVNGDLLVTGTYSGTPSAAVSGAGTRMFFDPESAAFRGGVVTGNQWNSGNIGAGSFGWGYNVQASGASSFVIGTDVSTTPAGAGGAALGIEVVADGLRSTAWGLGDATGVFPRVSGAESFGIFMGDQSGVNLAQANTMALLGGRFLIDQTPPANPAVSGTLSFDVEGDVGAIQYCDEDGLNCFTAESVATGGVGAPGINREVVFNSNGVLGTDPRFTFSSAGNLTLGGTGAVALPVGDGTNRPLVPSDGMIRYSTITGRFEGYQAGVWTDLITASVVAPGLDNQIVFNSNGQLGANSNFTYDNTSGWMVLDTTSINQSANLVIRGNDNPAQDYNDSQIQLARGTTSEMWQMAHRSTSSGIPGNYTLSYYNGSTWITPMRIDTTGMVNFTTNTAITLPVGQTSSRPSSPINGMLRYNSVTGKFEGYQQGAWQDILTSAVAGGAAAPNRGIQFNSGGNFAANVNLTFTSGGSFLTQGTYTGTADAGLPTGAGTRMFFDPAKGSFRAGTSVGTNWDPVNTGNQSVAFGYSTRASGNSSTALGSATTAAGNYSTAMGYSTAASGIASFAAGYEIVANGDGSFAFGLIDDAVTISARSQVSGMQSIGFFMGDQDGLNMTANNTMGLFGGRFVMDPRVPAQQLTPRADMDLGASTDALLLPIGQTANRPGAPVNGMLRYNSVSGKFEGYQAGAWQDILTSAVAGGAAAPDRGIQFNSGGNFAADANFVYTSQGVLMVTGTHTGVGAPPVTGAGTRMFFDPTKSAFRAGNVSSNYWNNGFIGEYSFAAGRDTRASGFNTTALGYNTFASGTASMSFGHTSTSSGDSSLTIGNSLVSSGRQAIAMGRHVTAGNGTAANGLGDGSFALGLMDDLVAITTPSQITGIQSMGIFMGDQDGLVMSADNTMGLFGGRFVMDPRVPAQQLTPRADMDLGASTDAILLPTGQTANRPGAPVNGMLRYNSVSGKFEGYQAGAWQDILTSGLAGGAAAPNRGIQFNSGGNFAADGNLTFSSSGALDIRTSAGGNTEIISLRQTNGGGNAASIGFYNSTSTLTGQIRGWDSSIDLVAMGNTRDIAVVKAGTTGNSVLSNLYLSRYSTGGAGSNGIGSSIVSELETTTDGTYRVGSEIHTIATDAAAATFTTRQTMFPYYNNAATTGMTLLGTAGGTRMGINTTTPVVGLDINTTDAILMPRGDTGQRPAGVNGMIRYNSLTGKFEGYQAGAWQDILTSAVAGGAAAPDRGIQFNSGGNFAADATFVYTSAGRLGIGSPTPAARLDIGSFADYLIANPVALFKANVNGIAGIEMRNANTGAVADFRFQASDTDNNYVAFFMPGINNSGTLFGQSRDTMTGVFSQNSVGGSNQRNLVFGTVNARDVFFGTNDIERMRITATGNVGIGTATPQAILDLSASTNALLLPVGQIASRPASPVNGMLRYNSVSGKFEGYQAGAWQDILTAGASTSIDALTDAATNYTSGNMYLGQNVGAATTIGTNNTALGSGALVSMTSGSSNVALGFEALPNLTTGSQNVAIGPVAGLLLQNGSRNTFIGDAAGFSSVTTEDSTGVGRNVLRNSTGWYNTALGSGAGSNLTTGNNNIMIGYSVDAANIAGDYQLNIGNLITGTLNTGLMQINGTGALTLPIGQTGNRPAGVNGMIRYNSQTSKFEGYQAGTWQDIVTGAATSTFLSLTDTPSTYAGAAGQFVRVNAGSTAVEFTDQVISSVTGQPAPPNTVLNDLGDVTITSPTPGQALFYSGGQWVNGVLSLGGAAANPDRGIQFNSGGNFAADANLVYTSTGRLGLATSTPSTDIGIGGNTARMVGMENRTTAGDGHNLTIRAGGRGTGNNRSGGTLYLEGGQASGTGGSAIVMRVADGWVGSGSTNKPYSSDMMVIDSNGNMNIGGNNNINDAYTQTLGFGNYVGGGNHNTTIGRSLTMTGSHSIGFGTNYSGNAAGDAANPVMSGWGSAAFFVGDVRNANVNTSGTFNIIGGPMFINPDTTAPTIVAPRGVIDAGYATDAIVLPLGATSQRPGSAVNGMLRYNSQTNRFEGYQGGSWQDILTSAVVGGAASPDRGIQFNSGGSFAADAGLVFSSTGDFMISGTHTGTASVPAMGAGTRMFFDVQKSAFRAGRVTGTEWNNSNIGDNSVALGMQATASGASAIAMGENVFATSANTIAMGNGSAAGSANSYAIGREVFAQSGGAVALGADVTVSGTSSMGLGLGNTAGTSPIVSGANSFGIFMGDQQGVNLASTNTLGLFGGRMVIDPRVAAAQFTARGVLDLGAATDAIVLPYGATSQRPGSAVNGMLRYNSQTNRFEGYQAGSWQDIVTGAAVGSINDLTDAITNYTSGNMYLGQNVGASTTTGIDNTALGSATLTAITTGQYNTAFGSNSLSYLSSSRFNTAVGYAALQNNRTDYNTAVGYRALRANTTGTSNIAMGYMAMDAATVTSNNIAIGHQALDVYNSPTDSAMLAIGSNALGEAVNGRRSVAIGDSALAYWNGTPSSSDNTAVGANAFDVLGSGGSNTGLGSSVGYSMTDADSNTFIGTYAGQGTSFGITGIYNNVMVGAGAGSLITNNAVDNVILGADAGSNLGGGSRNVLIGYNIDTPAPNTNDYLNIAGLLRGTTNAGLLQIVGTGAVTLPIGQTGNRPTGVNGMLRYNSQTNKFEGYQGGAWLDIITAGGSAATPNRGIQFNSGGAFTASTNLTYSSTGMLGIGTNNPSHHLTVVGDNDYDALISLYNTNPTGVSGMQFQNEFGQFRGALGHYNFDYAASNFTVTDPLAIVSNTQDLIFVTGDTGISPGTVRMVISNATGNVGIGTSTATPQANLDVGGTGAVLISRGTTGQRPGTPVNGMLRYNSQIGKFEGYQAGVWTDIITSGGTIPSVGGIPAPVTPILDYLSDVTISGPTAGQILTYSGGQWINGSNSGGTTPISSLTAAIGANTINNAGHAQTWNWNSATTGNGLRIGSSSLTTGALVYMSTSNTGGTGNVLKIESNQTGGGGNVAAIQVDVPAVNSGTTGIKVNTSSNSAVGIDTNNGNGTAIIARGGSGVSGSQPAFEAVHSVGGPSAAGAINAWTNSTTNGYGVWASQDGVNNTGYGLFAQNNSANGYALYSSGRFYASGNSFIAGTLDLTSTGSVVLPRGTTAQRPGSPVNGMLRYNSQTGKFEGYQGGAWTDIITAGGTAASPNRGIQFNSGGAFTADANFIYTATGMIGLGTPTPDSKLHVYAPSGYNTLHVQAGGNTSSDGASFKMTRGGTSAYANMDFVTGTNIWGIGNSPSAGADFAIWSAFSGPDVTKMFIGNGVTGRIGFNTASPQADLDINYSGSMLLPRGDTSQRPSGVNGMLRYNSQTSKFEGYQAGSWQDIVTGAATGGAASPTGAVQFNSGGSFGGSANFTWNNSTNALNVTGRVNVSDRINIAGTAGNAPVYMNLDALSDTVITSPTAGQILTYSGGQWINGSAGSSSTLDSLSDAETDYVTDFNMFLGVERLPSTGGQHNLGIGQNAGDSITTGDRNIAIGYNALTAVTTTVENIAIGYNALAVSTSNDQNIAIGSRTLDSLISGYTNVAVGNNAMTANVNGGDNVALGHNAMGQGTTGGKNVALGAQALRDTVSNSNIGIGYNAAGLSDTANYIIAIGENALQVVDGNNNIGIGFQAGDSITSGTDNILLGYNVDTPTATTSNYLNIGNFLLGEMSSGIAYVSASGAFVVPRGTTAQRPGAPVNGMIRYNSQLGKFEGYQAGAWMDIITAGGTAASPDRGIQFNSGNSFTADAGLVFSSTGDLMVSGTYTGTASVPATGAGTRMFFDVQKGAFRAGQVTATEWNNNNIGNNSVALGYATTASGPDSFAAGHGSVALGTRSTAFGYFTQANGLNSFAAGYNSQAHGTNATAMGAFTNVSGFAGTALGYRVTIGDGNYASGVGDGSIGLGVIDGDTVTISTNPSITGTQSLGIFMDDQDGIVMSANRTMGLFGGNFVIDPRVPAQQLSARGVIDVGAATDAIVMPRGDTAQRPGTPVNGMMRYNSQTNRFEGYQSGSWQDIVTGAASGVTFLALTDTPSAYTGAGGQFVRVNSGATALEFTDQIVASVTGQPAPTAPSIDYLGDVTITSATAGQILTYSGGQWINGAAGSGAAASPDRGIQFNNGGAFAANAALTYTSVGVLAVQASGASSDIASLRNSSGNEIVSFSADSSHARFRMFDSSGTRRVMLATNQGTSSPYIDTWTANKTDNTFYGAALSVRLPSGVGNENGLYMGDSTVTNTGQNAGASVVFYDTSTGTGVGGLRLKTNDGGANLTTRMQINEQGLISFTSTGAITLNSGTTAQRPSSPVNGMIRYNSQTGKFEGYQAGVWQDIITNSAVTTFISLTDTPSSYSGQANRIVRVNSGATALEFTDQVVPSVSGQPAPTNTILDDLGDVVIASPTAGQILTYSGGSWINGAAGGGGGSIDGLSDGKTDYAGGNNMWLGQNAGNALASGGNQNIGIGPNAGDAITTGDDNIAIGVEALGSITTGSFNTAVGVNAMASAGSGNNSNTAVGRETMQFANGDYNTVVGAASFRVFGSSGSYNTVLGNGVMMAATTNANNNTVIGQNSGAALTTGDDNVLLGSGTGNILTTGSGNILLGSYVNAPANSTSNYLSIGNTIYGDLSTDRVGIGAAPATGVELDVTGDIQYTGTITDVSDMRLKNNIIALNDRGSMLDKLDQIGTYSFTMKDDKEGQVEFGVMAQEINKVFPELVRVDDSTAEQYMSVNYVGLIAPLIEASKELKAENENLKTQVSTIEQRMAALEGDMNGMKAHTGYGISKAQMGLGMLIGMLLMAGLSGAVMLVVSRRRRQG